MDQLIWAATNISAAFLLPPGLFFLLLAIGIVAGRRHRWGIWLSWASLAVFFLLSLKVVAYELLRPIEKEWPPLTDLGMERAAVKGAAIVVLGGGRSFGALEYARKETLSRASVRRVIYAAQLARRKELPVVVAGGSPGGGAESEAVLMRDLLEEGFRIKVSDVEGRSMDTRQNASNVRRLLAARKIDTIVLVTDVTHMPRAARAFESEGLKVIPAPLNFQASAPLGPLDFVPSVEALELCRQVIREHIGAIWYRLRRLLRPPNSNLSD